MESAIAKITKTFLGREDHGIFTAYLDVTYGPTCQGIGGRALDAPGTEPGWTDRIGTAFGMDWIIRCIDACGVDTWEQIAGRTVLVYKDSDDWNARVIGIGPLPTEPGKPFMFQELAEVHQE